MKKTIDQTQTMIVTQRKTKTMRKTHIYFAIFY